MRFLLRKVRDKYANLDGLGFVLQSRRRSLQLRHSKFRAADDSIANRRSPPKPTSWPSCTNASGKRSFLGHAIAAPSFSGTQLERPCRNVGNCG